MSLLLLCAGTVKELLPNIHFGLFSNSSVKKKGTVATVPNYIFVSDAYAPLSSGRGIVATFSYCSFVTHIQKSFGTSNSLVWSSSFRSCAGTLCSSQRAKESYGRAPQPSKVSPSTHVPFKKTKTTSHAVVIFVILFLPSFSKANIFKSFLQEAIPKRAH